MTKQERTEYLKQWRLKNPKKWAAIRKTAIEFDLEIEKPKRKTSMPNRIEPTSKELLERELELRREILGTPVSGTAAAREVFSESARPLPPDLEAQYNPRAALRHPATPEGRERQPLPPLPVPPPLREVEYAFGEPTISFIDLDTEPATITTSLGVFDLTAEEEAQVAFIALKSIGRNIQVALNKLDVKHGVQKMLDVQAALMTAQLQPPKPAGEPDVGDGASREEVVVPVRRGRRRRAQ